MTTASKPLVLVILNGFGYREEKEDNAIAAANKPVWDQLWRDNPHSLISGSGLDVGLPEGQFGNSEVGHNALGAGRVFAQGAKLVNAALADGSLFEGETWKKLTARCRERKSALHFIGLLSDGNVHSHIDHLLAMISAAAKAGVPKLYVHALLDGRDVVPDV